MRNMMKKAAQNVKAVAVRAGMLMKDTKGENYVDTQPVRGNTGVPFMEIYDDQPFSSRSRRTALGRSLCTLRGCGDAYPYPEDSGHVQLCRIRNTGPRQGNRKNNRRIWRKTDA